MPGNCLICAALISRSNPGVNCAGECKGNFHLKCAKLPASVNDLSADAGFEWRCRACRDRTSDSESIKLLRALMTKVDSMATEVNGLKKDRSDLLESVKFCSDKIDDFNKEIEPLKGLPGKVDDLHRELSIVKAECNTLKAEVEIFKQQGRSNNLEICGVAEKRGENVLSIVQNLGKAVGVTMCVGDIVTGYRVAHFSSETRGNLPKNIVVKFATLQKRREFLDAVRGVRNPEIIAEKLALGQGARVYVNEHLSPFYKLLYRKAREFCRAGNFKYCWIKDTKILVKKDDSSRAIYVENEAVLSRLRA